MVTLGQYKIRRKLSSQNGLSVYEMTNNENNRPSLLRLLTSTDSHIQNKWYELYEEYQFAITNYKNLPKISTISMLDNSQVYTILEYQAGERLIDRKELEPKMVEQLLDSIRHLHRKNLIHGAINAENIWITDEGRVILYGTGEWKVFNNHSRTSFSNDITQLLDVLHQYSTIETKAIIDSNPQSIDDVGKLIVESRAHKQEPSKKKRVGLVEKKKGGLQEKEISPNKQAETSNGDPRTESIHIVPFIESVSAGPLQFFETKGEGYFLSEDERIYLEEFPQSIQSINWSLHLTYNKPSTRQVLNLECIYYEPDGSVSSRRSIKRYANEGSSRLSCSESFGLSKNMMWKPGNYRLAILLDGKPLTQGGFIVRPDESNFDEKITAKSLRFFETKEEGIFLSEKERVFQTEFHTSTHGCINWELVLSYPRTQERHSVHVECIAYNQKGIEISKRSIKRYIKEKTTSLTCSDDLGVLATTKWLPGRYTIHILLNGKKLTESHFHVNKEASSTLEDMKVNSFLFYESGFDTPEKEDRVYMKKFSPDETRYINWEITLNYPPAPTRKHITFEYVYYYPDGSVFGTHQYETYIEKGWDYSWHTAGYGFEDVGDWKPGTYKVDVFLEGKLLATQSFQIVKEHSSFFDSVQVESLLFFESGADAPTKESRTYLKQFNQAETRYVNWEVNLSYPEIKARKKVTFHFVYYHPDGSVFANDHFDTFLEKNWSESWHSIGYGYVGAGNWDLGNYQVEIKLEGRVLATNSFAIVSREEKKWYEFWK